jgi:hypothetical protein
MYLDKRDNMGFQVAPALIIFLVILGGGALVCCGFAVYRFWGPEVQDTNHMHRSVEQDRYMREVRERTWGKLPNYYVQRQQVYDSTSRSHMQPASPSVKYVDGVSVYDRLLISSQCEQHHLWMRILSKGDTDSLSKDLLAVALRLAA